ncbi:MAG: YdcF family protein [Proteobacteria bacterium]|nr:YdcF family protein [Pseudomonadota bacterium]
MKLQPRYKIAAAAVSVMAIVTILVTNTIIVAKIPIFNQPEIPPVQSASTDETQRTIIVLGAGVRRKELSGMLRCRMLKAITMFNSQSQTRILLSGDGTDPHYNETAAMRGFAIQNGINSDAILTDPLGFSTYDSLRRAIEVFGIRRATIVSQDFHLSRALWLAESFGIKADSESCDTGTISPYYNLREIAARSKDVLLRWFDFAPRSNREELF